MFARWDPIFVCVCRNPLFVPVTVVSKLLVNNRAQDGLGSYHISLRHTPSPTRTDAPRRSDRSQTQFWSCPSWLRDKDWRVPSSGSTGTTSAWNCAGLWTAFCIRPCRATPVSLCGRSLCAFCGWRSTFCVIWKSWPKACVVGIAGNR